MTDSMVDRLERAIGEIAWQDGGYEPTNCHDHAREIAICMLRAMREPTEAMKTAGKCTTQHWRRMIDVALGASITEDAK